MGMSSSEDEFDPTRWIDELSDELATLARDVHDDLCVQIPIVNTYEGVTRHSSRLVEYQDFRRLAASNGTNEDAREALKKSHVNIDFEPSKVFEVLSRHPFLREVLVDGDESGFHSVDPSGGGGFRKVKFLVGELLKLAALDGERQAATLLNRFLVEGDRQELKGHDITVMYGLKLDHRIDVGDGAYLAPYASVREVFGLPKNPEERRGGILAETDDYSSLGSTGGRDDSEVHDAVAYVREFRWGPSVAPKDAEDDILQIRYKFELAYRLPEKPDYFDRRENCYELIRDLLSITRGRNVVSKYHFSRVAKWISDIEPSYRLPNGSGGWNRADLWDTNDFDADCETRFLEMMNRLLAEGVVDSRIEQFISRIARVNSRVGRFWVEDKVVDLCTVLEMMYLDDGNKGEITQRLKARASFFLGRNLDSRCEIWDKIGNLYDARSSIVHGNEKNKRKYDLYELADYGYELVTKTLLKLMKSNEKPNWKTVVLSGDGNS